MRTILLILLLFGWPAWADAQIEIDLSHEQDPRQELSELVTNADIEPDSELTLLVLHGGEADQASAQLAAMLAQPRSSALQAWISQINIKFTDAGSSLAQRHEDLFAQHPSLPIVALVEAPGTPGEGAVWWSSSPPNLRLDETWLATQLSNHYAATIEAKARAGTMQRSLDSNAMPPTYIGDERPQPYVPRPRRPSLINPQINHNVDVPETIATNVDAGSRTEQMLTRLAIIVAAGFILGMIIGAWGRISAARTMADAETMDPEDYQRIYNAQPPEATQAP